MVKSGDISGVKMKGWRLGAQHPTMQGQLPTTNNYLAENINSAKAEKSQDRATTERALANQREQGEL